MGEIIQIHVGQAGVQIANACWEIYCLEHGINIDGTMCLCSCDDNFRNFFSIKDTNKVVPRAVLVDSEPTVIDQVRTGPYGHLYNPDSLISGKEDSGSNFARGYYTMGAELIDITMEAIRTTAESCCNLRGFLMFRSIGGGTGSGFGNLIAEQLKEEFDKISKFEFVIFPSPSMSPLIVEPYNALLATHLGMDSFECSFILDNEALYDICAAKLNICAPKYKNLNRIIGQITSTFTTSQRFGGSSNITFAEFQTNLVPYPRIHFPLVSYAPFIPGTESGFTNVTTEQITNACFDSSSQLVRSNPVDGKYMSCVLLYRGKVKTSDINLSIGQLRDCGVIRFVDWQPTGFKVGTNEVPPFTVHGGGLSNSNKALLTLSNNTIIKNSWCRLLGKCENLYSQRAFIHHYVEEGLEEDLMKEALEDICTLVSDYMEVDQAGEQCPIPANNQCGENQSTQGCPIVLQSKEIARKPERFEYSEQTVHAQNPYGIDKVNSEPILPGLESLNYFFSDPHSSDAKTNLQGSTPCACEGPCKIPNKIQTDDNGGCILNSSPNIEITKAKRCFEPKLNFSPILSNYDRPMAVLPIRSEPKKLLEPNLNSSPTLSNYDRQVLVLPIRSQPKKLLESDLNSSPTVSHYYRPRLAFPIRSDETERDISRSRKENWPIQLRKSKSFEVISDGDSFERPQRRSKSHEPTCTRGLTCELSEHSKHYQYFDIGLDTEAVRAKDRFSQSCQRLSFGPRVRDCNRCGPGEVWKLPRPRMEGKENLGEALMAKERFCNSTCQPQSCEEIKRPCCGVPCIIDNPCDTCRPRNCCENPGPSRFCHDAEDFCAARVPPYCCYEYDEPCYPPPQVIQVVPSPVCCPEPRRPACFCCQENDDMISVNSDDIVPPMCYRPPRCEYHQSSDCFCDHEFNGVFNDSYTVLVPPPCCPTMCTCSQEEEVVWCPSRERIYEHYPESRSIIRALPSARSNQYQADNDDNLRTKLRLPGQTEFTDTTNPKNPKTPK